MSSESDDPLKRSSSEHYDIIGVDLDWFLILGSASSIFFGFLLKITVDRLPYFSSHDNEILLAALYAVTIATTMFLTPVIYHGRHYRKLDVEGFLFWAKKPVRIGIACVMLAMYLALGLAFSSSAKIPNPIAYSVASLPFIFIFLEFFRRKDE